MIFDKGTKINRERTVIKKNGARKTGYPYAKGCLSNMIYKNCQNIKELNLRIDWKSLRAEDFSIDLEVKKN